MNIIILVEDNSATGHFFKDCFEHEGYVLLWLKTVKEAQECFLRNFPASTVAIIFDGTLGPQGTEPNTHLLIEHVPISFKGVLFANPRSDQNISALMEAGCTHCRTTSKQGIVPEILALLRE